MLNLLAALLFAAAPADSGYLTVRSNMPGLALYLEGDYIGRAPVEELRLKPGEYSLSIVSDDSLENVYWRLRTGGLGDKLSSTWTLVAINAGTQSVNVRPAAVTEVSIDYGRIANAPTEAKLLACCSIGALVGIGAVAGFLIHLLFFRNG
jgi:hypothetical protein